MPRRPGDLSGLPPIDEQRGGDPALLGAELRHVIQRAIAGHPRSQQTRIGPSEVGTPCARRLGYKLSGASEVNSASDGWKATIGTAVHAWLAEVFAADNGDVSRWLVEHRVHVGTFDGIDLDGSCDLYDRATATVIDWKVTTLKRIKSYRANGPGEQYRVQAHAYGMGWANRGLPVDTVGVVFLPRDGLLSQAHFWHEPYEPGHALAAMARVSSISQALRVLPSADVVAGLPTQDAYCTFCPYFRRDSTDLAVACPGHGDRPQRPDALSGLLNREESK